MNWTDLTDQCKREHNCSDFIVASARSRKDRKAEKEARKTAKVIDQVSEATRAVYTKNPYATRAEAYGSILMILMPFIPMLLREFLLGWLQKKIIDWMINRYQPPATRSI